MKREKTPKSTAEKTFFFFLAKDIYTWVNVKKNGFKICKGKYSN